MRQPKGVATLALLEMWERFSFYGMISILVLYFVERPDQATPPGPGLGFGAGDAAAVFGCYSALVYVTPLAGGWIGDRITGPRKAMLLGGGLIAIGHFVLLGPGAGWFWIGLLLVAAGTGLLKPNISAVLADLYSEGDPRRDSGFSLFYMGINVGAFLAPLVCGTLAVTVSWRFAFSIAGFGMLIGLAQYALGRRRLGDAGVAVPKPAGPQERRRIWLLAGASAALLVALFWAVSAIAGFTAGNVTATVTVAVVAISIAAFTRLLTKPGFTAIERAHLKGFLVLFIATVVYSTLSSQAGSTINEFTQEWIRRGIGSFEMPSSWLLSLNPVLVMAFAPVFAVLWTKLGRRAPSTPVKLVLAIGGVGMSFLIMAVPGYAAGNGQSSSILWVLATFLVLTWAELLLFPIALSSTTQLAPVGLAAQLLGLWYLASAVGGAVGGQVARLTDAIGYGPYFAVLGLSAIAIGGGFWIGVPRFKRLMSGVV